MPALAALALLSFPSLLSAQSSRFEEFTMTNPMVGDMAPDFTLQTVDGEELTLSDVYAEPPVVIEFGYYT